MLSTVQFEAQNARTTQALRTDGANSSLFALYLAMQINDPELHCACEKVSLQDEHVYLSIENNSAPKANLYSQERDYDLQERIYSQIASSNKPEIFVSFLNCLMPQALIHLAEPESLTDEVFANLPYETQLKYKKVNDEIPQSANSTQSQEDTISTFFNNITMSKEYDL